MKFGTAPAEESDAMIGRAVFIRTVTHHFTGRVDAMTDRWIVLSDCAWIADSGSRWHEALRDGTLEEVEPYPPGAVWISVGAVIDISEWSHPLPLEAR